MTEESKALLIATLEAHAEAKLAASKELEGWYNWTSKEYPTALLLAQQLRSEWRAYDKQVEIAKKIRTTD